MGNESVTRNGQTHLPPTRALPPAVCSAKQYTWEEGLNPKATISGRTPQRIQSKSASPRVKPPMNTALRETKSAAAADYNFRSALAEYVRSQALPVDKLGHQPRLYALTQLIGRGLPY